MKNIILVFTCISIAAFVFISCEDEPPTISDSTPYVKIVSPVANSSVSDTTLIKIMVNDIDVKRVELYIDHIFLDDNVFEQPPYEYLWDCRWYQEGSQHIIQAKAYDKSGKVFESDNVIINVYRFMPSNLRAEIISDSVIALSWIDNCNYETGFEIEQAIDDSNFIKIAQLDSNSTEYLVKGNYSLNTNYSYRVRAVQLKEFSGYSNISQAVLRLLTPINLNAIITSDTSAVLNWTDNNSFETGYVISKRNTNGAYVPIKYLQANLSSTVINETFYLNQYYNYSIHAIKDYYESPKAFFPSVSLNFPAPTNLDFEHLSETTIKLNWKDNSSFEKGFIIYRSDNGGSIDEIARVGANIIEYSDQSLDTSKTYTYSVKAFSNANTTLPSNEIKILFSKNIEVDKHISVPYGISDAVVSNDFQIVAIGGYISNSVCIRVFNVSDGTLINTFIGDSTDEFFWKIAISPDNKYVAASGSYQSIKIWEINSGQIYKRIEFGTTPNFIEYSPDGAYLFVESNMHLLVYHTIDWTGTVLINFSDEPVNIAVDPDQSSLAIGFLNSNLKVWDFQSGAFKYEIPNSSRSTSPCFDASGENLYFNTYGDFKVWNVNTNSIIKTINNVGYPHNMDITSDGKIAVYTTFGLSLLDIERETKIGSFLGNSEFAEVKFNPDNNKLFTLEFYSSYYLWDVVNQWVKVNGK